MSGPPEFVPLSGDDEQEPELPLEQQSLLEQLASPGALPEDSVLGVLSAAVTDLLHKQLAMAQMVHEMNAAIQSLIRQVDANHKKLHQLEKQHLTQKEENDVGDPPTE